MTILSNLAMRDIETLAHPNTNLATLRDTGPLVLEHGKGVFVYDSDGKPYLEGMAGLWCTALGYGNEELADTAAAQMKKLPFSHLYNGKSHDLAIELAEKLKEMAPVPISKVFFCNSGSEANDTQIKLVWYMNNALGRPKKKKIIGRLKGFHGLTIGAASLTGLPHNHADFDLPIPGILHTGCPHHYRFANEGETEEDFATRLADELGYHRYWVAEHHGGPMLASASLPITTRPPTMTRAPTARCAGSFSFSKTVASTSPPSAAQEGWITPPWASGTNRNPA